MPRRCYPGQSEAAPWVKTTRIQMRLEEAKALVLGQRLRFHLYTAAPCCLPPRGTAAGRQTQQKKDASHASFLLGYPDSNQEKQDQNLLCYHYTIAQCFDYGCKDTAFSRTCKHSRHFFAVCQRKKCCERHKRDGMARIQPPSKRPRPRTTQPQKKMKRERNWRAKLDL